MSVTTNLVDRIDALEAALRAAVERCCLCPNGRKCRLCRAALALLDGSDD